MNIGDQVTYNNQQFIVKENHIAKNKKKITILLNVFVVIMAIGLILIHMSIFMDNSISVGISELFQTLLVVVGMLPYIVFHEYIHGLAFRWIGHIDKKDISFGIIIQSGLAYCISKVPVKVQASRWSLMMPILVVCLPMYIIGLIISNNIIAIGAIIYFTGSVGDLYYMWKLRTATKNQYMIELAPSKDGYEIGYYLLEESK